MAVDSQIFSATVCELFPAGRSPALGPGEPNRDVWSLLESLTTQQLFRQPVVNVSAAHCCQAGLWLWHDFLDRSHTISQEIGSAEGSYWHGVMHRREPDYWNSKYWFRRVGEHPIFEPLGKIALELADQMVGALSTAETAFVEKVSAAGGCWDPFAFVDLCEAVANDKRATGTFARKLAEREWELLFQFCGRQATQRT